MDHPPTSAPPRHLSLHPQPGTSRRFGFAKFVDRASAADALEALRGTELKGKLLDLKFAVALGEPGPASGVQPKLLAKQRVGAGCVDLRLVLSRWAGQARCQGKANAGVCAVLAGAATCCGWAGAGSRTGLRSLPLPTTGSAGSCIPGG